MSTTPGRTPNPDDEIEMIDDDRITLPGLRAFEDNWDGEGALKPTEEAILRAEEILNTRPRVVPATDGGVQIDWPNGFEITISSDGTQELE